MTGADVPEEGMRLLDAALAIPTHRDYGEARAALLAWIAGVVKQIPKRDGKFLDEYWCCKVCGGEIPDGHTDDCDIWKLEKQHKDFLANEYSAALTERDRLLVWQTQAAETAQAQLAHICQLEDKNDALRAELEQARRAYQVLVGDMDTTIDYEREQNDALRAELEAARKDAERYRWLRPQLSWREWYGLFGLNAGHDTPETIDAAIDAASGMVQEQT